MTGVLVFIVQAAVTAADLFSFPGYIAAGVAGGMIRKWWLTAIVAAVWAGFMELVVLAANEAYHGQLLLARVVGAVALASLAHVVTLLVTKKKT